MSDLIFCVTSAPPRAGQGAFPACEPTDLEAISNTVAVCTSAVELDCRCMRWGTDLRPLMDRIFGTPFGNDRLRAIDFSDGDFGNAAEIVLACARECPHLRGLALPISLEEGTLGGLSFYEALARARPELTYLKLCRTFVEHDGILAAVSQLRLRCLEIENCVGSGIHDPALVDGILASPSAASLELLSLQESEWALGGLDVLRLVEGCPRLHTFFTRVTKGMRNGMNRMGRSGLTTKPSGLCDAAGGEIGGGTKHSSRRVGIGSRVRGYFDPSCTIGLLLRRAWVSIVHLTSPSLAPRPRHRT